MVSIRKIIIGKMTAIERSPLALSSTVPAGLDRVTGGQFLLQLGECGRQLRIDRFRFDAGKDIRLDRDRGQEVAPPDYRLLQPIFDGGDLAQRDRLPVVQCDLQVS